MEINKQDLFDFCSVASLFIGDSHEFLKKIVLIKPDMSLKRFEFRVTNNFYSFVFYSKFVSFNNIILRPLVIIIKDLKNILKHSGDVVVLNQYKEKYYEVSLISGVVEFDFFDIDDSSLYLVEQIKRPSCVFSVDKKVVLTFLNYVSSLMKANSSTILEVKQNLSCFVLNSCVVRLRKLIDMDLNLTVKDISILKKLLKVNTEGLCYYSTRLYNVFESEKYKFCFLRTKSIHFDRVLGLFNAFHPDLIKRININKFYDALTYFKVSFGATDSLRIFSEESNLKVESTRRIGGKQQFIVSDDPCDEKIEFQVFLNELLCVLEIFKDLTEVNFCVESEARRFAIVSADGEVSVLYNNLIKC
ncbi:MAG: hypothetical protein QXG00_08435 [Candidatus Woesearchaeota archaeon]